MCDVPILLLNSSVAVWFCMISEPSPMPCVLPSAAIVAEYGLFKPDEDPKKGQWLELGRTLEYYHLKNEVHQWEWDGKEGKMMGRRG